MNEEKYDIALIDRYVTGQLEGEELQQFEVQINTDPDLRAEVSLQKDLLIGTEAYFDEKLKNKLKQVDKDAEAKKPGGKQIFFKPWKMTAVAASFLLMLTVGYFFFYLPSIEEPFIAYYEPYPNIVNPIERSDSNNRVDGLSYYEKGDFKNAVDVFDQELVNASETDFLKFYQAISFLEIDQVEKAITLLQGLEARTGSKFRQPAEWYLALAYFMSDRPEEGKGQLQKIINAGGDYQPLARELFNKL